MTTVSREIVSAPESFGEFLLAQALELKQLSRTSLTLWDCCQRYSYGRSGDRGGTANLPRGFDVGWALPTPWDATLQGVWPLVLQLALLGPGLASVCS